ncbi:Transcription factor [Niveomyces insectorum RCEF 264]|uniref:Transcription factor n=1 Tax=Niveomyces insectorum RCEF 264 TaxID=1081102 RepID=A0A167Q8A2_9HYPO|nr:Transcription factor [Niveomyces insectorum RCEF 264]
MADSIASDATARPYRSKKQRPWVPPRAIAVAVEEWVASWSHTRETAPFAGTGAHRAPEASLMPLSPASPTTPHTAAAPDSHRTTVMPGRTVLYTGNSSDQDVYLLRHLPFDDTNSFGHSNWRVWKIFADEAAPAYFTSYPNTLLDVCTDIYNLDEVNAMVGPYHSHLLDLYYAYAHPSMPVLEERPCFEACISARSIPASLLAAVYNLGVSFWHLSPLLSGLHPIPREPLYHFVFHHITLEARTPSLRTVQAMLLHMQCPPFLVREPNHPGFWALTGQLVAIAQDMGLHVDPTAWTTISPAERKTRRVLWWAVYMHDKWLAHWLGRPSHIDDRHFSVAPLTVDDFVSGAHPLPAYLSHSIAAFVTLSNLTTVLSSVLDSFYTISQNPCSMTPEEALSRASQCQAKLNESLPHQGSTPLRPSRVINDYALVFAHYGIAVSIQRALFACVGGTLYYDIQRETHLFRNLFDVLEDLLQQDLQGLWLSYCKSNIAMIGSFIITALLSSTDDAVYQTRHASLYGFRSLLYRLAERFEFAALPLLRLNLLLERFADNAAEPGIEGPGCDGESGEDILSS